MSAKGTTWKRSATPHERGRYMTQEDTTRAIMYLCAQPRVAAAIRKLWPTMPLPKKEKKHDWP